MKRGLFAVLAMAAVCHAEDPAVPTPAQSLSATRVEEIIKTWEAGDHKRANADVKLWMKTQEHSPWPWVAGAGVRFHEKKYGGCISMADAALKRDPTSADAFYWRGRCLESKGKTLEAANEYGAALEAQPAHPAAQEGRDRLKTKLGETPADGQPN